MALCTTPPCVFFHRERNLLPIVGIPLWFRHSGKTSSFQNRAIALLSKFNSKLSAANQLQRCLDSPTGILPISENLQRSAYTRKQLPTLRLKQPIPLEFRVFVAPVSGNWF